MKLHPVLPRLDGQGMLCRQMRASLIADGVSEDAARWCVKVLSELARGPITWKRLVEIADTVIPQVVASMMCTRHDDMLVLSAAGRAWLAGLIKAGPPEGGTPTERAERRPRDVGPYYRK